MLRIGGNAMKLRRVPLARRCVPFSSFPDSTSIQQESSRPTTINAINHELFNTFKSILSNMHNNEAAGSALNTPMANPSFSQIKPNRPLTMVERQIEIEEKQHSAAVTEQAEMISSLRQLGRGTSLKRVQRNLVKWYEPLTEALQEEIRLIETNAPGGDRTRYGPFLLLLPVEKIAVIALDTTISSILRSGNAGVPTTTLTAEIGNLIETEVNLRKLKDCKDEGANWAKRLLKDKPRESIQLFKKVKKITADVENWSWDIKVKVGASLVKILLNSVRTDKGENVFKFSSTFNVNTQKRQGLVKIAPESFIELDSNRMGIILPRFLPMLVPPQPWNNKDYFGAYLRLKAPILKHTSRLQLEATKKAEMKSVLEGLDYLGKTSWRINKAVFDVVYQARDRGMVIGEIPNPEDIEVLSKQDFIEKFLVGKENTDVEPEVLEKERHKTYEQWRTRVEKKNAELHSLRCDIQIKLSIASQFANERMYFPHNLDFRGRAYPIPPNLSHLGSDLCRGILMFDDAKTLGPDGLKWLKIHLANLWGYNKVPFEERVAWVERHMEKVIESAKTPLEGEMWWTQAESPYQALATCIELHNAYQLEDPTQYQCRLPVHQDGSCNGLQHYAGLGRDLMGGKAVNLTPSQSPQDVYTKVLEFVIQRIDEDSQLPADSEDQKVQERRKWALIVKNVVNRKVIKQTVMTSVYGVTKIGARAQVQARLMELFTNNSTIMSSERERELYWAANYVAGLTLESLHEIFDNAKKIMDWLALVSLLVAGAGQTMSWITPLGLPVTQPYRREAHYAVKTVLQNVILTLNSDLLPVSSKKQKTAFPPNFVHSLDATHMLMTCLKMKERKLVFAAVHDSYWTHACDVSTMNDLLRKSFVELYEYPVLEELAESIRIRFPDLEIPPIPDRGQLDIKSVLNSTYFFH